MAIRQAALVFRAGVIVDHHRLFLACRIGPDAGGRNRVMVIESGMAILGQRSGRPGHQLDRVFFRIHEVHETDLAAGQIFGQIKYVAHEIGFRHHRALFGQGQQSRGTARLHFQQHFSLLARRNIHRDPAQFRRPGIVQNRELDRFVDPITQRFLNHLGMAAGHDAQVVSHEFLAALAGKNIGGQPANQGCRGHAKHFLKAAIGHQHPRFVIRDVGDAGQVVDESTQRFERLLPLLFGQNPLTDILDNGDEVIGLAIGLPHQLRANPDIQHLAIGAQITLFQFIAAAIAV